MADGCGLTCGARRAFLTRMPGLVLAALMAVDAATVDAFYPVTDGAGTRVDDTHKAFPIPAADGVTIDKGAQVILVRLQGRVIAFNLACPHENNAVRWKAELNRFQCSKHDSKYAPDGTYIGGRATRNMDRLPITRDGNQVIVDLSRIVKSDEDAAAWAATMVTL
ncbi:MAG: ubiquinol-cytochrome c reductase iron-sulfur subunit [Vicinamibacterales bacterium]